MLKMDAESDHQEPSRTYLTAEARREAVVDAAIREFGRNGLAGASADKIASDCGISQPYIFRLFGTKKNIFLAAVDRTFDLIEKNWIAKIQEYPNRPALCVLAKSYLEQSSVQSLLMMQLQAYASSLDEEIGTSVRAHFVKLQRFVESHSDEPSESIEFLARGLLINVLIALRTDSNDRLWKLMRDSHASSCEWCNEHAVPTLAGELPPN